MDPGHRELLVHETVVAGVADVLKGVGRGRRQHAGCEEAEAPESVVDRDDDDVVLGHHHGGVVVRPGAVDERAAVNPYEDRQPGPRGGGGRSIDVEEQAILGIGCPSLRAGVADGCGDDRSLAGIGRLRRLPAQCADRRLAVADTEEDVDSAGRISRAFLEAL